MDRLKRLGAYLLNVLIALDRLANAVIGGSPGETLSSVSYRKCRDHAFWGWARPIIDRLFWFQPNHCAMAYLSDRTAALPI